MAIVDSVLVAILPSEPSRARLLTALTVVDSYIMTLPHAEDSFRAFAVNNIVVVVGFYDTF